MSRIYKIAYNNNNKIEKVFVFIGDNNVKKDNNISSAYPGADIIYVNQ